jgi:hypothetical protein
LKDKALKQRAKDAETLAKQGNYKAAQNSFSNIYQTTGDFSAGYNAAIMTEASGDVDGAIAQMQKLVDDTGNPKAGAALARMQKNRSDTQTIAEKFSTSDTVINGVVKQASADIMDRLPQGSKLSMINISRNEAELTDYVIDSITSNVINSGAFTVIDRKNSAFLQAEK